MYTPFLAEPEIPPMLIISTRNFWLIMTQLQENVFNKGYAEVLIAEQHSEMSITPVGMALVRFAVADSRHVRIEGSNSDIPLPRFRCSPQYFYSFSTWTSKPSLYLEDLYVIPTLRNKGVGKLLFKALGQVAQQKDCARMDWSVLTWNA